MRCQYIQHPLAVSDTTAGQNFVTEHEFLAVVMQSGAIKKQTLLVWLLDGPSRKAARDFLHVLLRVAAVNAERVQLHQLARVIFIEAAVDARRFVSSRRIRTRHAGPPVVE